jgi:hypothetical protein
MACGTHHCMLFRIVFLLAIISLQLARGNIYHTSIGSISPVHRRLRSGNMQTISKILHSDSNSKKKNEQLINFFAGGIAGSISSILTIPLEVVKTQLQSSRMSGKASAIDVAKKIFETDGLKGFFRGITPLVVGKPSQMPFFIH